MTRGSFKTQNNNTANNSLLLDLLCGLVHEVILRSSPFCDLLLDAAAAELLDEGSAEPIAAVVHAIFLRSPPECRNGLRSRC
jgi:hypothetical protein